MSASCTCSGIRGRCSPLLTTTTWCPKCSRSWRSASQVAVAAGIAEERICVDPGIGFGKTPDDNLELVRRLDALLALGRPVVVGFSRKSTLARVLGSEGTSSTASASVGAAVAAFERGAWMLRVHDVAETVEALAVAAAVERGKVSA